jgi:hypothetical protein
MNTIDEFMMNRVDAKFGLSTPNYRTRESFKMSVDLYYTILERFRFVYNVNVEV